MQNRVKSHPAAASPSSSSGGDGSGFCLSDIMDLDAGSGGDHKALGSPRSKHSATEQRRRCKINERFQMLRDLVPQSDQKRDRATFLLEVIEYVKFLQEKVQKHESCTGGDWSQEKSKLSNNQMPVDLMPCEAPATTYCSPPDFLENSIPAIPEMLQNAETLVEPARLNADSIESQYQSQWQLPCPANCPVNSELSNEKEEMTIDEGTITVSSVYSQNIFTALTDAMENLGIDLSQASVTVHVNLGRRAMFRRPNIMSSAKEQKGMPAI
uniref:Uncharacterized protein n=1 Tax=Avena sativa TaxID=4498 RepID=A0ACD5WWN9_AVESA